MTSRPCIWGLVACLGILGTSAAAADTPRMVIQREGSPHAVRGHRPAPLGEPAARDRASRPEPRPFPHDLYAPGAERPSFRPVSEVLRTALGVAAQPAPETLRLAVIRVDFEQNTVENQFTGTGRFDLRPGPAGVPVDPPPHDRAYFEAHGEALRRFYDVQSYGSLQIEPTVFPPDDRGAYSLSDPADYGPWEVSQSDSVIRLAERFVGDAVGAADASGDIDFASFDAFVVVHAGADFQGDIDRNSEYDIPSFTITLADSIPVNGGSFRVGRVLVLPESPSQDGRLAALNGVFAHEFGHILNLPDLYNIFNGYSQVGYFSLMDSGENIAAIVEDPESETEFVAEGIFPTSLDPWSKLQAFGSAAAVHRVGEEWEGLLEATQVNPFLPSVPVDALETFLVENRALDLDGNDFPFVLQDSTTGVFLGPVDDPDNPGGGGRYEYDAVLPGGGVFIWHVDDRLAVPGFETGVVNLDVGIRGVALEEADGVWDLGRNTPYYLGRPQDAYYLGNNTLFSWNTVPGSEANDGAYTGITIEVTTVPSRFMGVRIERPLARDGWPVVLRQDAGVFTRPGALATADVSGGPEPEVLFNADVTVGGGPTSTSRGLVALFGDGTPDTASGTFWTGYTNTLRSGIGVSDGFVLRAGEAESTVVAGVSGSRPLLWNRNGENLLGTSFPVPALTPPLLYVDGSNAGWVLFGSRGSLHAMTVPGTLVYGDTVAASADALPTAGPLLIPSVVSLDLVVGPVFAVAFEGGALAFFVPGSGAAFQPPYGFSSDIRHLVSGLIASSQSVVAVTGDSVAVVDPTGGITAAWPLAGGVVLEPVLGDVDEDNRIEIGLADTSGTVSFFNGDGSQALGWPKRIAAPARDLKLADVDGDGSLDVLALDGGGRFHAWDGRGRLLETWPRPLGPFGIVSSRLVDLDGAGELTWVATSAEGVIHAMRLPGSRGLPGDWRMPGHDPERSFRQELPAGGPTASDRPDLEDNPIFVYPNPARGSGVEIRFILQAGESASLDLIDVSGRVLDGARLDTRGGFRAGENAVRWDLANVAPGLYFCRLERRGGPAGAAVDLAKIVVVR